MRKNEHKFVRIPEEHLPDMIGKIVHLAWASFACQWRLLSVNDCYATLETPKTRKPRISKVSELCFTRQYAEEYLAKHGGE